MAATQVQQSSASSSHLSLKNVAQKVVGAVKQHNKEVNAAYQAYYGVNFQPTRARSSESGKARPSVSTQ
ncbi:hypothetical protein N431DRAFT_425708 [Stipitochalara longipes BDJ]|nr:hypothetical protein N431DRAFT_425708 [Stipitochalara longipes BDJ]